MSRRPEGVGMHTSVAIIGAGFAGIGDVNYDDYFREVPLGQGQVPWQEYLAALREIGFDGFLTIEREVGENPDADIRMAADFLRDLIR